MSRNVDERSSPRNPPDPNPHHPLRQGATYSDPAVMSLFGPGVTQWVHLEEAFVQALALKTEQEKTKQEFYRLEVTNRSLELLRNATQANVPGHLIPLMFSGDPNHPNHPAAHGLVSPSTQPGQPVFGQPFAPQFAPPPAVKGKPPYRHDRSQTLSTPRELYNANPTPPSAYRFGGGGPPASGAPPHRPLSPAKLGAKGVASLSGVRPLRSPMNPLRSHQRNMSMPNPSAATIPESSIASFTQGSLVPTQESMTSLQHVIQFHHWQPESHPKETPFTEENERKRRKSLTESEREERDMLPPHKRPEKEAYSGVNVLADAAMNIKREGDQGKPLFPNNILSSPV